MGTGRLSRACEHVAPSPSIRYKGRICERARRVGEGGELSEITKAIEARQAQITQLQSDIETLQGAASVLGAGTAPAKAPSQPKPKQHVWTAAEKAAIGKRMKAYWAKRRKAKG